MCWSGKVIMTPLRAADVTCMLYNPRPDGLCESVSIMSKSLLTKTAVNEMCGRACFCLWPKIGCSDLWLCLTCNYEWLCSNRWRICTTAKAPFSRAKVVFSLIMECEQMREWKKMLIYAHPLWRWRIKAVRDALTWPVHVWACCLRSTNWHVVKHNPSANLRLEWGGALEMSWKETLRCQWLWMSTKV